MYFRIVMHAKSMLEDMLRANKNFAKFYEIKSNVFTILEAVPRNDPFFKTVYN